MKLLISSCLLGENVRYDGSHNKIDSEDFKSILSSHEIFSFCPEVKGGLATPRTPAEIDGYHVVTKEDEDVTAQFLAGAYKTLELCEHHNIKIALLKSKSPSCGNKEIYDGSFEGKLVSGEGVTAQLLQENGIVVFNEKELDLFQEAIR